MPPSPTRTDRRHGRRPGTGACPAVPLPHTGSPRAGSRLAIGARATGSPRPGSHLIRRPGAAAPSNPMAIMVPAGTSLGDGPDRPVVPVARVPGFGCPDRPVVPIGRFPPVGRRAADHSPGRGRCDAGPDRLPTDLSAIGGRRRDPHRSFVVRPCFASTPGMPAPPTTGPDRLPLRAADRSWRRHRSRRPRTGPVAVVSVSVAVGASRSVAGPVRRATETDGAGE